MRKRKRYFHYATTLLVIGTITILMGASGFVGADETLYTIANLTTSLLVFGGVMIGLSALLFMSAISIEK